MALDIKGSGDLIGVSRLKQVDEVTAQTLDAKINFNEASGIVVTENREDDQSDKTGFVEATEIDILDKSAEGELSMDKTTPDFMAWAAAMFMDDHSVSTPQGTVRLHTSTVNSYPEHPAYFTAAHRKGGSGGAPAALRQHIGVAINQFTISGSKEEFVTAQSSILGLGLFNDGLSHETFAVDLSAALTVTLGYDPFGADDVEMADIRD